MAPLTSIVVRNSPVSQTGRAFTKLSYPFHLALIRGSETASRIAQIISPFAKRDMGSSAQGEEVAMQARLDRPTLDSAALPGPVYRPNHVKQTNLEELVLDKGGNR